VGSTSARRTPPRLLLGLGVVLIVQALFVVSYVGALHKPQPRNVPFGTTGASPLAAAVEQQISLQTKTYADEAAARRAIDQRTIYGALITGDTGGTLLVAPAASNAVATALTTAFTKVAAATGEKLSVVQVHELADGDRLGIVSFLAAMALVVGGYLAATIATTLAGQPSRRTLAVALGCVAVIGALMTNVIAGPVLGGIPDGHFFELWGVFALVMMAVAFAAAGLQRVLGAAGTLVVIVAFVIFGAPAAGGSLSRPFLPGLWATIGPFLPPGAATTFIRNTIYFDGNGIVQPLVVLAAYLVAGTLAVLGARRRSTPQPGEAEADVETAAGAAAVVV
jgi:hypothetical protein